PAGDLAPARGLPRRGRAVRRRRPVARRDRGDPVGPDRHGPQPHPPRPIPPAGGALVMSQPGPDHLGPILSALLDGELEPGEQTAAADHLAGCDACRAELERTAWTRRAVRD